MIIGEIVDVASPLAIYPSPLFGCAASPCLFAIAAPCASCRAASPSPSSSSSATSSSSSELLLLPLLLLLPTKLLLELHL